MVVTVVWLGRRKLRCVLLPVLTTLASVAGAGSEPEPPPAWPSVDVAGASGSAEPATASEPGRLPPMPTVFDNTHYPQCCTVAMPGLVCMYRIPVVLHIPRTSTVRAVAEARLGAAFNKVGGCSDGAGPGLPMRRSTDSGATWGPMAWIANDTQPEHVAKKDHIVMGMAIHDPKSATSFLFYTACYQKCVYTTTYVIRSSDAGRH